MPGSEPITDDIVAEILKKDAKQTDPGRYLSAGLGSLLGGSRRRGDAPKPNTRFLRNIVKEADSHNAALRRREAEDSRQRMRHLRREDREKTKDQQRHRHSHRESEKRARSGSRCRSRSPRRYHGKTGSGAVERRTERDRERHVRHHVSIEEDSDSDPLETVIGPKAPSQPHSRGRGANNRSAMDSRFDPKYDPKADVCLDQDEVGDDWDRALEALRDRAKWRKSGGERLRAAGFNDDEVAKWEKGGGARDDGERDISDVRWNKKGEGREWDRGKTIDGGRVDVKASWAS